MRCFLSRKVFFSLLIGGTFCFNSIQAQDTLKLKLDDAIKIALNDNPTIKVAGQEITLKKVASQEAYAGLLPEASLVGNYSRAIEKQSFAMQGQIIKVGTDNTFSGGLSISLPLFAPALYKSISLTKTDIELSVEKSRASKLDMVNQVTKAFYQLLLAQDSYDVLLKSYKQSEDNFNVVKAKYDQGIVSEYDKISAEVQMRNIKPSVVSANNAISITTLQLKVLLGLEPSTIITIDGNLKDYEMAMFNRMARPNPNDLTNNTTLKQLDLNKDALNKTLKLQRANFMPTLSASFQYMYTSMNNDFKFSKYIWNPYSTFGLSLSVPLFKGSNFTKLKQTKIKLMQLDQTKVNTERQLVMQATTYLNNMSASTEQVVSNKEAVLQAEKGRVIAEKRYEVGKGTILELNSSEVALTQSKLTYNQSIYDYLIAKADLDLVIGDDSKINE